MRSTPKVNGLIFKELIKRGYSLDGHTRIWNIADSKLWYLKPEQAKAYLELENSKNFKEGASGDEFELLNKYYKFLLQEIGGEKKPFNLVDIGCGDGKKAAFLIEHFGQDKRIRYCPIDISSYMVKKAIETVAKIKVDSIIESKWNISDFENLENITPLLLNDTYKSSLFIMLGHTLGNFEIHDLLYQIRNSMKDNDVFAAITGVKSGKWEKWINDSSSGHINYHNFLKHIPLQLGLTESEVEFIPRLKNSRVEYAYVLKKNKNIEFQGRCIDFKSGDQIIVAIAYKHNKENLQTILRMYFKSVILKFSEDKSTVLLICKK